MQHLDIILQALQGLIPSRYMTDEESYGVETDQESYIRTDDEDGGNTDWGRKYEKMGQ